MREVVVAVDAMGGDNGPGALISGLALAQSGCGGNVRFLIFGDERVVSPLIKERPSLDRDSVLIHKPLSIEMGERPGQALRRGRGESSMWGAVSAVKEGRANVAISCGNTGALMAISKIMLQTLPGILRPAIAGLWPTLRGHCVVLDLGATIADDAIHLVQFAVMGQAFARVFLSIGKPKVGILNIGKEEIKGTQPRRLAARFLSKTDLPMEFIGFIEGNDIGTGLGDVVVTDGFSGNIALKVGEGTARQILQILRAEIGRSFWGRIGYLFMRSTFARCRGKLGPDLLNGGVFLGLNGLVVKSHGRSDAGEFSMGVKAAVSLVEKNLQEKIASNMHSVEEVVSFDEL